MGGRPFAVTSTAQIRGLLERGRIDIFATSSVHEAAVLAAFGDDHSLLSRAKWRAVPFYHLLNPRHQDKIARLNTALAEMIRSGDMAHYLRMPGVVILPVANGN